MWLDNRVEGSTSRVGVPANTPCNYPCVVLVTLPNKIQTTGNPQEIFLMDYIKMTEASYNDK